MCLQSSATLSAETWKPHPIARGHARVWTAQDGLLSSNIRVITQTRDGYLWLGTREALTRFDGMRFVHFHSRNTPGMRFHDCTCLLEDADGRLWIGTKDGLVLKEGGTFRSFEVEDGLPGHSVTCLAPSGQGIWIGTRNGLCHYDGRTFRVFGEEEGLTDPFVHDCQQDAQGNLWVGTRDSVQVLEVVSGRFTPPTRPEDGRHGAAKDLLIAHHGECFALFQFKDFRNYNLYRWEEDHWTHHAITWYSGEALIEIGRSHPATVAVAASEIIYCIPNRTRYSTNLLGKAFAQEALYESVFLDSEGILWIGVLNVGLCAWTPSSVSMIGKEEGLPRDLANAATQDAEGNLWVVTPAGITRYDGTESDHFAPGTAGMNHGHMFLAPDRRGRLWAGGDPGLQVYDGRWRDVPLAQVGPQSRIRALLVDLEDTVWVGHEDGLTKIHDGLASQSEREAAFAGMEVRALLQRRDGRLVAACPYKGIFESTENGWAEMPSLEKIAHENISGLFEDRSGTLYASTDDGFYAISTSGRVLLLNQDPFSPGVRINAMLQDDAGFLWFADARSLHRIAQDEMSTWIAGQSDRLTSITFDASDGLLTNEMLGRGVGAAACKARDGRLWFPTMSGLAVVDPADLRLNRGLTPPIIERMEVDGEVLFNNEEGEFSTPLHFPPGSGQKLKFDFTSISLRDPERVTFCYRLAGKSDAWVALGRNRTLELTGLEPGDYRLELEARNGHGFQAASSTTVPFTIEARLIEETWFRFGVATGLAVALAAVFLVALYRVRLKTVREERDHFARDLHDGIGSDLARLALMTGGSNGGGGSIGADGVRFSEALATVQSKVRQEIWAVHSGNERFDRFLLCLLQDAEHFLRPLDIRCRFDIPPDLPAQSLSPRWRRHVQAMVREVVANIAKHAGASKVAFTLRISRTVVCLSIEDDGSGTGITGDPRGQGLGNIRERIASLRGTVAVEQSPGVGTRFDIRLPFRRRRFWRSL